MLVAFIWHQGIQFSALPLSSLDIHSEWKSWWGAPPEASKRSKHGGSICRVVGKIKELFGLENLSPSLLLLYVCSRTFTYTLCPSVHKRPEPKRVVSLGWMTLDDASRRRGGRLEQRHYHVLGWTLFMIFFILKQHSDDVPFLKLWSFPSAYNWRFSFLKGKTCLLCPFVESKKGRNEFSDTWTLMNWK